MAPESSEIRESQAFIEAWNRSCHEAPSPRTKDDIGRADTLAYLAAKRAKA